jgi:ABC-type spermidine/putrescine transport system permease subunit I
MAEQRRSGVTTSAPLGTTGTPGPSSGAFDEAASPGSGTSKTNTTLTISSAHRAPKRFASAGRRFGARVVPVTVGFVPVLITVVFIGVPVVLAVLYTLGKTGGLNETIARVAQHQVVATHGFTLEAYRRFIDSKDLRSDLWVTFWVTVVSTAALLVVAVVLALFVRFSTGRVGRMVSTVYVVPMFIPTVIASYALVTFWQQNGKLAGILHALGLPDSWVPGFTSMGVVIGLVWTNIPFAVILLASSMHGVPDVLIDAARDVGASWPRVVWSVLLPLCRLPLIIIVTFTAIGTLGNFTIPDLMGPNAPQMLGVAMTDYYQSYGQPQQAEVMAVLVFLAALVLSAFYVWASRADRRRVSTQGPGR